MIRGVYDKRMYPIEHNFLALTKIEFNFKKL